MATRDGAGAWMRNASAVHEGQVTAVLEAAASLGLARPPPPPEEYDSKDEWKDALAEFSMCRAALKKEGGPEFDPLATNFRNLDEYLRSCELRIEHLEEKESNVSKYLSN